MASSVHLQPESAPADVVLGWALENHGQRFAIVTSFQAEGMVLVDMAARVSRSVRIITLDTGRLPAETYAMIETVRSHYGVHVEVVAPDAAEVEAMATLHGPDLFRQSLPHRSLCCEVRKVRPLERKLRQLDAWAVGLRREQSATRAGVCTFEDVDGKLKISPLADWPRREVEEYIARNGVPRHPLYERGYTSIGCAPCTRATAAGEDERAGRWWWEQGDARECGLHFRPDGGIERTVDVLLREVLETARA